MTLSAASRALLGWVEALRSRVGRRACGHGPEMSWSPEVQAAFDAIERCREDTAFAIDHSVRRVSDRDDRPGEVAVISCMPPAETGIATATLLTFREAVFPVDIYAHYTSPDEYLCAITDARLANSRCRVFDLGALPLGQQNAKYGAQIYAIGNSTHNLPVVRTLRRNAHFPPSCRVIAHIHDPCLHHVLGLVTRADRQDLRQVIRRHYRVDPGPNPPPERLVDLGIFGIRPLFSGVEIDTVIVNSRAAAEMVRRELPGQHIEVLFHPAFDVAAADGEPRTPGLRIGTFGVPGGDKRTEVVVDAFEMIRRVRPDARLVVAGFKVGAHADACNLTPERGFEVHDAPTDREFARLIASVDVAVQLRKQNLGESSGVMARLAGSDIPVITSSSGAFAEYAQFASVFAADGGAAELADMILRQKRARSAGRLAYVAARRPEVFCARLYELAVGDRARTSR
jgi:glycosyltransferase involved in cell wall biosynthesis